MGNLEIFFRSFPFCFPKGRREKRGWRCFDFLWELLDRFFNLDLLCGDLFPQQKGLFFPFLFSRFVVLALIERLFFAAIYKRSETSFSIEGFSFSLFPLLFLKGGVWNFLYFFFTSLVLLLYSLYRGTSENGIFLGSYARAKLNVLCFLLSLSFVAPLYCVFPFETLFIGNDYRGIGRFSTSLERTRSRLV